MCRHLAYLGPPVGLDELLFTAPHSLAHQAERPRHQVSGDTNPDGWGVAWYGAPHTAPAWYRTVTPIWDDRGFATRAATLRSGAFLAAARLASPGATLVDTGNAPFVEGLWSFSLNGIVHGFPDGVGDELRARVAPERQASIVGDADTEVLFALVLQHLAEGMPPADALARVVHDVLAVTTGRLNLLLTDGALVHATCVGNSLFRRGPVIASEPTDGDPGWVEIPDRTVTVLTPDGAADAPL
ncbi:MAG TPA: class II glutamine amidotransferase [Acidimicrobiia bacterium]|jgi:glutamine amidotransferase